MNLKHLTTFITVARCGSFSKAASQLHTVQSAVSRHINALEEELGIALLERTTRHVELTPAGEVFLQHLQDINARLEQARQDAIRIAKGQQGTLRIGYLSSACAHFLPETLRLFKQQYPAIDIAIYEMTAAQQMHAFEEKLLDIGFSRPMDAGQKLFLEHQHLIDDSIYAVVNNTHRLASSPHVTLAKLAEYPLTLFARHEAPSLFDTIISAMHQDKLQPVVHDEPTSMQALLTQIAASDHVALVPGCIQNLQTSLCTFVPVRPQLSVPLQMHWLPVPSATTQTWVDWWFQNQPRWQHIM